LSTITVIGSSYVGLTTGACLARLGHNVVCTDLDQQRVDRLNAGDCPILEKGLDTLLAEGLSGGRLRFELGNASAADAEFVFLCVQTPQSETGAVDLSYVEAAAAQIGPILPPDSVVINKSTVPVGAVRFVERVLGRSDVHVVSNPEFLREGSAVHDFLHPERVVIGADDQSAAVRVASLYIGVPAPTIVTDPASAEMIKYAANAFLATKLSFVNAIATICEAVGADIQDVVLGMGYDRRIGSEFLRPGPGWGGSCFPKDTVGLVHMAAEIGYDFDLLQGVIAVNEAQFSRIADRATELVGGSVDGLTVAAWGLTFKAGTDDLRESPSLAILDHLQAAGATVRAYDPTSPTADAIARHHPALADIEVTSDPYSACDGASILLVLTEWDELRWLDFAKVAGLMATPRMLDARGLLDRELLRSNGFQYASIGRP
jgi:UDPglucose 6-dehydrogenase